MSLARSTTSSNLTKPSLAVASAGSTADVPALRASQAQATPRSRRASPHSSARRPTETFKVPPSPSTVRSKSRVVSTASTSSAHSLNRSLSRSTSAALDSPHTVRLHRTLASDAAGSRDKKAALAELGLGGPQTAKPPSRRTSSTSTRSVSNASSTQRTPLRNSSRNDPALSGSHSSARLAPSTTTANSRSLASSRRPLGGSAIPVSTTAALGRTLRRPDTALSTASSNAQTRSEAGTTQRARGAAAASERRPSSALSRSSSPSGTSQREVEGRASQAMAPGRTPQIALSPPPGSAALPSSFRASTFRTPRKADEPSFEDASPDASLSHFSHASFLSPAPPPPSSAAASAEPPHTLSASTSSHPPQPKQLSALLHSQRTPRARARARESLSLEELLRLGLARGGTPGRVSNGGGGSSGAGDELELLLDEGTSRLMLEEIGGGKGSDGPVEDARAGPLTPWRGRVVSVSSARRNSLAASLSASMVGSPSGGNAGTGDSFLSPPRGIPAGDENKVLLLRQSTAEASDLRRQLSALQSEVDRLRTDRDRLSHAHVAECERDSEAARRMQALEDELERAHAREEAMRGDWDAERREMECEMAELASVAASAPPPPLPLLLGQEERERAACLERQHAVVLAREGARTACASEAVALEAFGAGARRDRAEVAGALETVRALAQGLQLWSVQVQ
ncbi:uncharacterized protein JCM10292_004240 [Rhodotorula paludigena]|uniref:uncharacterized protein n=1 Tax=Rhodotorula paludigena TaxID=86838 RepID=UPI00317ED884